MPIILTFQSTTGDRLTKGPYASIRLDGELIREREDAPAIASHLPHGWHVEGKDYLRVDSDTPVAVLWEGSAPHGSPGTTGHFSSVDGVAYIDRRILAFIDRERGDWYLLRQGQHKSTLILQPSISSSAP